MSIFTKIATLRAAATHESAVAMTKAQVAKVAAQLRSESRLNVYPNQFNVAVPFKVTTKTGSGMESVFTNYGTFTSVDVASAVGTIVSASIYGDKALRGNFDAVKAEAHPEMIAWLNDDRNQEIISKVA